MPIDFTTANIMFCFIHIALFCFSLLTYHFWQVRIKFRRFTSNFSCCRYHKRCSSSMFYLHDSLVFIFSVQLVAVIVDVTFLYTSLRSDDVMFLIGFCRYETTFLARRRMQQVNTFIISWTSSECPTRVNSSKISEELFSVHILCTCPSSASGSKISQVDDPYYWFRSTVL